MVTVIIEALFVAVVAAICGLVLAGIVIAIVGRARHARS
jgi:hypothetical protein